ncbi:MAG: sigma-70 family RNA polymerase sigma factor [Bacteroidia bacterium]|nr:sigma-70 family RNA polymerase sigma factor [Bacteroidia bacterium]
MMSRARPTDTDDAILDRIAGGDHGAYAVLLHRYRDRVMNLCYRMLAQREDAEEAASDAFLRAFRALPRFENRARFSTWLYRITHNVCLSRLAKRKREPAFLQLDDEADVVHADDDAAGSLENAELTVRIDAALSSMRPEYAEILTLFYREDQGYDEIALITNLPLGTVKNRLHRARRELQRRIFEDRSFQKSSKAEHA